jgi:hypothetical protein
VAGSGDIASSLAETLDAFDEYYRFLRVPVGRRWCSPPSR